jgi:peptidoglycan/xylan/chitin deacetylase (PgdA/CDA1 family)
VDRAIGASGWRRRRLLILAYHGISLDDEHQWNGALYMSPSMFEQRLQTMRSVGCSVLPLAEALMRLYEGTLQDRSVAVTFDDGYFDFAARAYPLLAAYGVPATVYLRTHLLGEKVPIFRLVCSYVFWKSRRPRVRVPELRNEPYDIGSAEARANAVSAIADEAQRRRFCAREEAGLLRTLGGELSVDIDSILQKHLLELMSTDDVTRLAGAGVDFQLHTHSHNTPRDARRFAEEIETNRGRIQVLTGRPTAHFCYPSGNYNSLFFPWLTSLGVRSATTCDPGLASPTTPPLMLPRFVDTSSTTPEEFEGWLRGTTAWLSRKRSYAERSA